MVRRFTLYVTLFSWLLATGTQWDVVQVGAWAKMIVVYSQNMTLLEAVQLTFSREGMCDVCRLVESAKQHGDEASAGAAATAVAKHEVKAVLPRAIRVVATVVDCAPVSRRRSEPEWDSRDRAQPPAPPPRAVGAMV